MGALGGLQSMPCFLHLSRTAEEGRAKWERVRATRRAQRDRAGTEGAMAGWDLRNDCC